jgi:hypothetical protein
MGKRYVKIRIVFFKKHVDHLPYERRSFSDTIAVTAAHSRAYTHRMLMRLKRVLSFCMTEGN